MKYAQIQEKLSNIREYVGLPLTVEDNAKRLHAIYHPNEEIPDNND